MKYKLTLETDNYDEILLTVSSLRAPSTVMLENDGEEPAKEIKERKPRGPNKIKNETVIPLPVDTTEVERTVTAEVDSEGVKSATTSAKTLEGNPYDAVKTVTLALIKAKGKPAALELLAEFEVKAATELKNSDYDAYVNRANILLGKAA